MRGYRANKEQNATEADAQQGFCVYEAFLLNRVLAGVETVKPNSCASALPVIEKLPVKALHVSAATADPVVSPIAVMAER